MANTTTIQAPDLASPPARGRRDKRDAITRAARIVFGREGYSRSSIDTIAAEAGVSTRTIYNHFDSKEQLFTSLLLESANEVASAFIDTVARELRDDPSAPEHELIALGHALAGHHRDFPEHFAMVRQINAEAPHFPEAVIDAWQDAGPRRVHAEISRRLRHHADRGLLRITDADRAALHFIALTNADIVVRSYDPGRLTAEQVTDMIDAGVHAFLNGYAVGSDQRSTIGGSEQSCP